MSQLVVLGMKDDWRDYAIKGYTLINTTSKSRDWGKELSPFFVGPVNLYSTYVARNVENAWQFSKVYPEHVENGNGRINLSYFEWRRKGWADLYAHRYPMGKGAKPLFSYWDGERLDYIEARKKIYAPVYSQGVVKTDAFRKLKELYDNGEKIALIDFDGYDHIKEGKTLVDVINDPHKKMGHAFVLAMLLTVPNIRKRYGI